MHPLTHVDSLLNTTNDFFTVLQKLLQQDSQFSITRGNCAPSNNFSTNVPIFMKRGMNVKIMAPISSSHFLILYHRQYEHGDCTSFWGGSNNNAVMTDI